MVANVDLQINYTTVAHGRVLNFNNIINIVQALLGFEIW